jgi:hypothetical protein
MYIDIGANSGSEKLWTKTTATSGKLIKQYMFRTVMFIFSVQVSQVGYSKISYLLDYGFWVWGAMREKFVSKAVDENQDGLDV